MTRVLVTGASGLVGRRALVALRRRGLEVHAVARQPSRECAENVAWHAADLLEDSPRRALLERVRATHLLHLAWYAKPGAFWTARENAPWVAASIRLVEEFADAGGKRAVLAGTCAEYDWAATQPLHEDAPLRPTTFYGVCKDATRRVAERLAERLGLSLAWGRIFFLYGPGEHERRLVASVARALAAGERAAISDGSQRRDFLHVDDVAGAFAAMLDGAVTGPVNVASGEGVAVRRIAELLAQAAGRPDLLEVGAVASRADDPPEIVGHAGRLCNEVGFTPAIDLRDGLERTVAWWRGQGLAS